MQISPVVDVDALTRAETWPSSTGSCARSGAGWSALLLAQFRRLDLVEDALGDAVEAASRTWPADGVPDNPAGLAA